MSRVLQRLLKLQVHEATNYTFSQPSLRVLFSTSSHRCSQTAQVEDSSFLRGTSHLAQYGGRHTATLLTGDGVGPELLAHVKQVFRYAACPVQFEELEINASTSDPNILRNAILSVQRNGVAIKGNIETKFDDVTFRSMNVALRTQLDLFASVVRCKNLPGVKTKHKDIDVVLIRENTEGEYSNLEHENVNGVVESLKIITRVKSTQIAKYAFDYATSHGRKKVTAIHKANIMKLADGLFLQCCRDVAALYPHIEFNDMIVDNACMQMVSRPQQFDVMVMPNLYGSVLGNLASGLVGGAGVTAGMNIGRKYAIFEMGSRSSGRTLKGKGISNPTGMLLASCEMLDYLGHKKHATLIRESLRNVIGLKMIRTPDMGGQATTNDFVQAIIEEIKPKATSWLID